MKTLRRFLLVLTLLVPFTAMPAIAQQSSDPPSAIGLDHRRDQTNVACARVNICSSLPVINGEAWAGNNQVWQADFFDKVLTLRDLTTCQVIKRCVAPGGVAPSELTMYQGMLVHYDFGTGLLYFINPDSCKVLWTCDAPGDNSAEGLTSDGVYLYKAAGDGVHKFTSTPNGCVDVGICPNPPGDSFDGLTMCQGNLVGLGYSGMLYLMNPNCGIIGTCPLNSGASGNGLASDGTGRVFVDDISALTLDEVDVGCQIPLPVQPSTWSKIKAARYN